MKNLVLVLLFLFSIKGFAKPTPVELIQQINKQWQSSDRYIDEDTLVKEALPSITKFNLDGLIELKLDQVRGALEKLAQEGKQVNQGIAENIFKIRHIALRRKNQPYKDSAPRDGEVIFGLTQDQLDAYVQKLPAPDLSRRGSNEFNNIQYEIMKAFYEDASANDYYALKIAALWWSLGVHKTVETTSEVFFRGNSEVNLIAAVGQDYALLMLGQMRFREIDIQHLKRDPSLRLIPSGFWNYLRSWRYSGNAEIIQPGTLVGANTPVLQMRSNPVDTALAEAPSLALMDEMARAATYGNRIIVNSGGRPISEGGTRRGRGSYLRALAAWIAGFSGTSDVKAARLFGIPNRGSAQNHSSIGQMSDELEAHTTTLRYFPSEESFLLTDTYNTERGVKIAARASRPDIKGFRLDSPVPDMDPQGTVELAFEWLKKSGFIVSEATRGPLLWSDDANEYLMKKLIDAPYSFGLVGGRLRNGPSLGIVLKSTSYFKDGQTHNIVKSSNPKKALDPGEKSLYRIVGPNGQFIGDIKSLKSNLPSSETAISLFYPGMVNGNLLAFPDHVKARETMEIQRKRMPKEYLSTSANSRPYPVSISPRLEEAKHAAVLAHSGPTGPQVGVMPMSGDPIHDGHIQLLQFMKERYLLDRVYVVITGDNPIHGRDYSLTAEARLREAKRKLKDIPWVVLYEAEVKSRDPIATVETLRDIQKLEGEKADLWVMTGEDLFLDLPNFVGAREIVDNYNWIGAIFPNSMDRAHPQYRLPSEFPRALISGHKILDVDGRILRNSKGKVIELGHYPALRGVHARDIRKWYDSQPYAFRLHITDPQWTFVAKSQRPTTNQSVDGSLAGVKIEETIPNLIAVANAAVETGKALTSGSGDAHYPVEVREKIREFGKPTEFGDHGMKGIEGPKGDSYLEEVEEVFPRSKQVLIPNNVVKTDERGSEKLVPADFNLNQIGDAIFDRGKFLRFEKQTHSVPDNPHYREYMKRIDPYKLLPHFHDGYCTDFCIDAVVEWELREGYDVIIIVDSIAGIYKLKSSDSLKKFAELGARFMTTEEFKGLSREWTGEGVRWSDVKNSLAAWEVRSKTKELVIAEISKPEWRQWSNAPECAIVLRK